MVKKLSAAFVVVFLILSVEVHAIRESRPTAADSRIRVINYSPDDVIKFVGYYGYQTAIELDPKEEVINITMGYADAWQIVPIGHRIFIKPTEPDATTNMTLITDRRTYFFELHAEEALDIKDPNLVFNVRFLYPDDDGTMFASNGDDREASSGATMMPNLQHPESLNFNYSISGDERVAPIIVFDDGEFTYVKFRSRNGAIPAMFAVDEDLKESLLNHHVSEDGKYIVIEQVIEKITVRQDDRIACLYNEAFKY